MPSSWAKNNKISKIWDTAGQEKYHAISQMYYRGQSPRYRLESQLRWFPLSYIDAGAAIIVFDVTNRQSYDDMKTWREEVQEKGPPGISIKISFEAKR